MTGVRITTPTSPAPVRRWEYSAGAIWMTSPWNARVRIADVHRFAPANGIDSEVIGRLLAGSRALYDAAFNLQRRGFFDHCDRTDAETSADMAAMREAIAAATPPQEPRR